MQQKVTSTVCIPVTISIHHCLTIRAGNCHGSHDIITVRYYHGTILSRYDITPIQYYRDTILSRYNIITTRCYHDTILSHYDITTIRYFILPLFNQVGKLRTNSHLQSDLAKVKHITTIRYYHNT